MKAEGGKKHKRVVFGIEIKEWKVDEINLSHLLTASSENKGNPPSFSVEPWLGGHSTYSLSTPTPPNSCVERDVITLNPTSNRSKATVCSPNSSWDLAVSSVHFINWMGVEAGF